MLTEFLRLCENFGSPHKSHAGRTIIIVDLFLSFRLSGSFDRSRINFVAYRFKMFIYYTHSWDVCTTQFARGAWGSSVIRKNTTIEFRSIPIIIDRTVTLLKSFYSLKKIARRRRKIFTFFSVFYLLFFTVHFFKLGAGRETRNQLQLA